MTSPKSTGVFWGIAIAIPLIFFLVLEFGLRALGYGQSIPLFMSNPQAPHYYLPTPDVVKRYFHDPASAPNVTIETNFFKQPKSADGLRIFVQGGSTAAGFPYGYATSIAGMLDYRLKQSFPERQVEVINTALSAVNSYTILDFVDEIIEQQPDAVLIYAGHNEYLGILGVGSAYTAANSRAATLLYLKLKDLRLFQLMQQIYAWFSSEQESRGANAGARTMMAKVAKHKNIPLDSDMFAQGQAQFAENMALVLDKYQRAGIPVFISTIASNLASQKPFSSTSVPEELAEVLTKPVTELQSGQLQALLAEVDKTPNADIHFYLGQYYQSQAQYDNALSHFEQAREHDLLRFRAPLAQNKVIKALSQREGVYLIDAEQALVNAADNGIIGESLMIEHLHPTVKGYGIIANSFYQGLEQSKVLGQFPVVIDDRQAHSELPIFAAEKYWGEAKISVLMADYPFTDEPQMVELKPVRNWSERLGYAAYRKQVQWLDIAKTSLQRAREEGDEINQIKAVKLLSDAIPYHKALAFQAGKALIALGRAQEAPRYLKRVLAIAPDDTNAMLAMAHAYIEQKKFKLGLEWINRVLVLQPQNPVALTIQPQLVQALKGSQI